MQAASDKTFHLKWNNHLQNLSQLFSAIYSSSALADVTLACRDGTLRAHKLVLSACSPYFEQIFKDNPCKHPVVILKGIPFSEINLLVEFMYKGSVDVQEMDLQSLMHTASELEIRGLAYEVRANAAQLLNVNLEYPTCTAPAVSVAPSFEASGRGTPRTDMERLKQIHLYQQSMLREAERRRRRDEPTPPATTAAVKSILAAAAKELADGSSERTTSCVQTEEGEGAGVKAEMFHAEEETWSRPAKKRVSIFTPEEEKLRRKRLQYEIRQSPQRDAPDGGISKLRISAVTGAEPRGAETPTSSGSGIKVVQLSTLQHRATSDHNSDDEEASSALLRERSGGGAGVGGAAEDDDSCSSGSASESAHDSVRDSRPHVCDICDIRFQRASHLNRHRLTHTGERPFTCGGCGKSFARSDKLRVHTKICERDDPTVDMVEECKAEASGEVTAGTVRITHRDSRQLMFTPSGDVMLAPRAPPDPATPSTSAAAAAAAAAHPAPYAASTPDDTPAKRGRGRPKKPVPDVPKIKKRRGRPPKALSDLDMMMGLGNGVSPALAGGARFTFEAGGAGGVGGGGGGGTVPMQQHITPSGQQLIVKRKRGRPPKNYFQPLPDGRPNENYNATNLPFGDFSYLTEMMNYPGGLAYAAAAAPPAHPFHTVTAVDPERDVDMDTAPDGDPGANPTDKKAPIDLYSSSSDEGTEDSRPEPEDTVPAAVCETEIMTVGDCQILKLPPSEEPRPDPPETVSENGNLSITAIAPVGDCTVRPLDGNA